MNVYVVSADEDTRFLHHDPVSPELALVDPELARRERAQLPHPWEREARARIACSLEQLAAPARDVPRTVALRGRVRQKQRWVGPVAVALAFVTIVTLADVPARFARTEAGDRTLPQDLAGGPLARAPSPSTPDVKSSAPPTVKPKSSSAPAPSQPARPGRVARSPLPTSDSAIRSKPAPTKPQFAKRSFAWAPTSRANAYHVEFFRGDVRIFAGDSPRPAITLPVSWQFGGRRRQLGPGEYRWYVWPILGGKRRGEAIVQAELTVPST